MRLIRNEPGINVGDDFIKGTSHSEAASCSFTLQSTGYFVLPFSERSLASRFAVLQNGEGKKRASADEDNVLNIQLAAFIDRFLPSTKRTKKETFL